MLQGVATLPEIVERLTTGESPYLACKITRLSLKYLPIFTRYPGGVGPNLD